MPKLFCSVVIVYITYMNKFSKPFIPEFITVFREGYSKEMLVKDVLAGIIVGVVALPLAIAFAIASGVSPQQGLITAVLAGFITAVLGGSRVQVSGPTGAFIVVIYGIVVQYGYDGLAIACFMAGILLVLMGLARFGSVLKFIPFPVTVGFTAGIAVTIAVGQIPAFLGVEIEKDPPDFVHKLMIYAKSLGSIDLQTLGIGTVSILIIIFYSKFKIPSSLIAIIVSSIFVKIFDVPVATIGDKFGEINVAIPKPQVPNINVKLIQDMFMPAFTIAVLAGIESLLSAVVADGMTGKKHRSNTELIAQGVTNIVSPIFGGIPSTGAIARTATNIKNGAQTPVASIVHALTLVLIVLFFGKMVAYIPMATLAAILFVVAYNMGNWKTCFKIYKAPKSDFFILLLTFSLTVLVNLTTAIQMGVMAGAFLFLRRMADVSYVEQVQKQVEPNKTLIQKAIPEGVSVYEVYGSFFFGAIDKFQSIFYNLNLKPKVLILRMHSVQDIDSSGLDFLETLLEQCRKNNIHLMLSEVHLQPIRALTKNGFITRIGFGNMPMNINTALEIAEEKLG